MRWRPVSGESVFSGHLADCDIRAGPVDLSQAPCERRGSGTGRREFLELAGIRTAPITDQEAHTALVASSCYGKGRGHPARLNLGDCFAYAVARNAGTTLLFKGDDFDKTDIRPAVPSC